MKYIGYCEKKEHGTREFPCECYHVTDVHPRYSMIYHWHNECELILIRRGSFCLNVDSREYTLREGDCAFVVGGAIHGGEPDGCVYDCLVFDAATLLKCCPACASMMRPILNRDKQAVLIFEKEGNLSKQAGNIIDCMHRKEYTYEFSVQSGLLTLFGMILEMKSCFAEETVSAAETKKKQKFKNVLTYIENHFHEQVTLEQMAEECGMNRNYFCRAFKEYTGRTPVEYLNYYRIQIACEMIAGTKEKLSEISKKCGFNDYSYFIKVFKLQKGVTPRDYCRS